MFVHSERRKKNERVVIFYFAFCCCFPSSNENVLHVKLFSNEKSICGFFFANQVVSVGPIGARWRTAAPMSMSQIDLPAI
jgi:hypothetical protein